MFMPNLEHDYLALVLRQVRQRFHRFAFRGAFVRIPFEPAKRLPFPGEAAPKATPVVQGPVAEGANTVMLRAAGPFLQFKEGNESFLHNVFGLAMTQPQGASIQDELGGFVFIKRFAPTGLDLITQDPLLPQ